MEKMIENFYKDRIKKIMPLEYSSKEHDFASRIFKSISVTIWENKNMTNEEKLEYLKEYNLLNLKEMLIETVETIKSYKIDKPILLRDLTSLPTDWLFYNQKIHSKKDNSNVVSTFKTIKIFSTGKLKLGFQNGTIRENGDAILNSSDKAMFEEDKCYVMLSFKESKNLESNEHKENIFLDYYLGNINFN